MTGITELGYMRLGVSSLSRWKEYATEILGLELVDEGEPRRVYLRMDSWHHRFILEEDGSDDLNALGLRVAGQEEFAEMRRRLDQAGVRHEIGSRALARDRHVLEIMILDDPNGNPIEIFHGPHVQYGKPFHPGRRMYGGFATGTAGMGHCLIRNFDIDATYKFYTLLGMTGGVEYRGERDGVSRDFVFFHCNDRQHTLGFGIGTEKRINHVMIEAKNFDDLAFTYNLVKERQVPIGIDLGKHANDHLYSFYCANPSGWMCEYAWGSRPALAQSEHYDSDVYGHAHQDAVIDEQWHVRTAVRNAAE
jgi:2,3-dihydroxyethylbenzene 1,2-dioxygenase